MESVCVEGGQTVTRSTYPLVEISSGNALCLGGVSGDGDADNDDDDDDDDDIEEAERCTAQRNLRAVSCCRRRRRRHYNGDSSFYAPSSNVHQ